MFRMEFWITRRETREFLIWPSSDIVQSKDGRTMVQNTCRADLCSPGQIPHIQCTSMSDFIYEFLTCTIILTSIAFANINIGKNDIPEIK